MEFVKIFKESWLSKATSYIGDNEKIQELLKKVTSMFSESGLSEVVEELKLLVSYVKDVTSGKYKGYSGTNLAIAVGALIYVVSPVDIIPDILPGGFVDDAAIVAWAIKTLHTELEAYKASK